MGSIVQPSLDELIDEEGMQSFPASDAPSWTLGRSLSQRRNVFGATPEGQGSAGGIDARDHRKAKDPHGMDLSADRASADDDLGQRGSPAGPTRSARDYGGDPASGDAGVMPHRMRAHMRSCRK